MVLKELIFNSLYFWEHAADLKRTDFQQFLLLGGCGGLERTDF